MPQIEVLDEQTIDKIAAGEVVERPSSAWLRSWWRMLLMRRRQQSRWKSKRVEHP